MRLINYYIKKKFNPVPIKTNNKLNLLKHVKLRKNLIQNHLKIPLNLLKDKDILEFGPNRGENSFIYALNKANLFFVEPVPYSAKQLKAKYKHYNLNKFVKKIDNKSLEKFHTKQKFDLVIAEGFLNTLDERDQYLTKILKFVKDSGLVILNYDDYFGSLIELIKSAILKKYCIKKKIRLDSEASLKLSKQLYYQDFRKLKNTRPFKAYWLDQLSCEFAEDVWKFEKLLDLAYRKNFYFYSSSPMWSVSENKIWYKNINLKSKNNSNKKIFNEWKKNLAYFVTGNEKIKFPGNQKIIFQEFDFLIKQIINFLKNKKTTFKKLKNKKSLFFNEINSILSFLNDKSKNLNYKKLKTFRSYTGTNLHYLCLKKNEKNF